MSTSTKANSSQVAEAAKGTVFVSYSRQDSDWRKRVQDFLGTLEIWENIEVWADDRIDAGEDWYREIREAIDRSAAAVLLLTKDFLRTGFIAKEEVPELLRRRERLGMKLIPLLIHDCPWNRVRWLRELNIIPPKAKPLDEFEDSQQNTILSRMTEEIGEFLEGWKGAMEAAPVLIPRSTTVDLSHLPETSTTLFGRDAELDALDSDWESPETRVVAFVAAGGAGKSALINRWLRDLQVAEWRGAERVFGWSFYSQGTGDQAATADLFINTALRFFGDPEPGQGSAWDRGDRLARLAAAQRTLLVLDGLERLQSKVGFERGHLSDPGLHALLRRLVRGSQGLCLITTREHVPDLEERDGFRAVDLGKITPGDGRAVLRSLHVEGTDAELETLAVAFGPTALCVTLLGTWLCEQPGHNAATSAKLPAGPDPLSRLLGAFETMLGDGQTLDLLRILGLFDRPAPTDQVAAALGVEALEPASIAHLRELRLLALRSRHSPNILEAHPVIREHYARQLRDQFPDRFREGHRRLYEYLCETSDHLPDTVNDLQPLYQAVAHGCKAGLHTQALCDVYRERILRGTGNDGFYSTKKLGAFDSDLGAVASFFDHPWTQLSSNLSVSDQAWLLNQAGVRLRARGQLTTSVNPTRAGLEMYIEQKDWKNAAITAGNLSEIELILGRISAAIGYAEKIVDYTVRSREWGGHWMYRASYGDALNQAGHPDNARSVFAHLETIHAGQQPNRRHLYSGAGYRYCDLLLSDAERSTWQRLVCPDPEIPNLKLLEDACAQVTERATQALEWAKRYGGASRLTISLDRLTLGRAALYALVLGTKYRTPNSASDVADSAAQIPHSLINHIDEAVDGLRKAGYTHELARGLLTRALQRQLIGNPDGALSDLDETLEMAKRGPMPLYQADVQLTRVRILIMQHRIRRIDKCRPKQNTLSQATKYLAEARRFIDKHGYHRRDQELADAEAALRIYPDFQ